MDGSRRIRMFHGRGPSILRAELKASGWPQATIKPMIDYLVGTNSAPPKWNSLIGDEVEQLREAILDAAEVVRENSGAPCRDRTSTP